MRPGFAASGEEEACWVVGGFNQNLALADLDEVANINAMMAD